MSVQDWFALALRVIGVAIVLPGLGLLLDALLMKLGYVQAFDTHPAYYLIYGAAQVVAGLYLINGAPSIVGFAYPTEDEDDDEDEDEVRSEGGSEKE